MKPKAPKPPRDVNANVHRIFDEMIERNKQPPKRGSLKIVDVNNSKSTTKR